MFNFKLTMASIMQFNERGAVWIFHGAEHFTCQ